MGWLEHWYIVVNGSGIYIESDHGASQNKLFPKCARARWKQREDKFTLSEPLFLFVSFFQNVSVFEETKMSVKAGLSNIILEFVI